MKKHLFLTAFAVVLGITGVVMTKANTNVAPAWSIITGFPSTCAADIQPQSCTMTSPGVICTVGSYTYYRNSSCTVPWYKPS